MRFSIKNLLRTPHTSRIFVGRQKISTRRLVCGEFRQVCDKIGACRAKSDSARSQNVLWALSATVRWTKAICRRSRAAQSIRTSRESHVSGIGAILILNDPAPSLDTVRRDKKSASGRQADGPTNLQFYDKKSAGVRQPLD